SEGIGRRNITYNHTNMPVQISYKGGTPTYLTYDGEGNRIKKVQGASTTIYVGDIFEKRGAIEVSHIYANGKRIMSRTSDGKEYYTHTDHLGSTNLVTDETGQVIEENGYLPFGGALFRNEYNGGTFKSAYRYTGQELDSEYELYNYNARLYDPVMSRFISPDTIIPDPYNPQSLNRYAYCLNNPLKYTDPSGHMDEYTLPEIVVNGYRPMSIEDILTWINMTCVPPEPPSAFSPLSRDEIRNNEEFRILVATVYGEAGKSSKTAWKAITCVALNRVGKREWSKYHTVKDIIAKTGFDAYGRKTSEYKLAIEYLAADKLGTNQRIDNIAKEIYPIYIGFYKDITENAVLYYSPKAQLELSVKYPDTYSATPKWDFEVISEVTISGMQSTDDFKFYKYK
ncbi:MAG: RHS repeat-associated core domain-containing protein, partial [Desulfatiglans sp.]|nr:RHS repeat-associated core domain-containing protein [Desulfatiglans sp.]